MDNPENRPTNRILADGRRVPTNKGLIRTTDEITRISEAQIGRPRPKELVLERSTVWSKVKPLFMRGGLPREIANITGLTYKQVKNSIYRRRPEWHSVPRELFSPEKVKMRRRMAEAPGQPKRIADRTAPSESEMMDLEFAKVIYELGLITDDLTAWQGLNHIYARKNTTIPGNFAQKLRLELFYKATEEARRGECALLINYRNLGEEIGTKWFGESLADEEDFISIVLDNAIVEHPEDSLGLYREDKDGRRWRLPMVTAPRGGLIFDSLRLAVERARSRRRLSKPNLVNS